MTENPTIARVRKARHEISRRHGHDTRRLVEHYMKYQQQFADRLISKPRKSRAA